MVATPAASKKRILLINPPSPFLLDERVFPPMGILSVAAVAEQHGHAVDILDTSVSYADGDFTDQAAHEESVSRSMLAQLTGQTQARSYDLIGITATSPQFSYAYEMLQHVRQQGTTAKVVIGGPHASVVSSLRKQRIQSLLKSGPPHLAGSLETRVQHADSETLRRELDAFDPNFKPLEEFDHIAAGEENGLLEILNGATAKWLDGGLTASLDALPLPALHLLDTRSYLYGPVRDPQGRITTGPKFPLHGSPTLNVMTQRGCPFDCYFCCGRDLPQFRQVRFQGDLRVLSKERLLQQLEHISRTYGVSSFMFYDDEFNLSRDRTLGLLEALATTPYHFRGFVKAELLVKHPEVAEKLAEAGFVEILTGVESGSHRILKDHVRKNTTPEINYAAAELLHSVGVGFKALTMVGHPTETYDDVMATKKWLLHTGQLFKGSDIPFSFDVTIHQPYPGAPVWDRAVLNTGEFSDQFAWVYHSPHTPNGRGGLYFNKLDFSRRGGYYKGVPGEYSSSVRTQELSPERFVALRDEIDGEVRHEFGMPGLQRVSARSSYEHSMGAGLQFTPKP